MKRQSKFFAVLFLTIMVLTFLFTWGNSMLPAVLSNKMSDAVTTSMGGEIVRNGQNSKSENTALTSAHVRKLAHLTEYAVLGLELLAFSVLCRGKTLEKVWSTVFLLGILTALIDETLQLLSDRHSTVVDVWLDLLGFTIGVFLMHLIFQVKKRCKKTGRPAPEHKSK